MPGTKVLVLCATGKAGRNVSAALKDKGYEVYGTTRNEAGKAKLEAKGVIPVICDYTNRAELLKAFGETGCKKAYIITDFFLAAKSKINVEIEQGKMMVDVCKEAACDHVIYSSAADSDKVNAKVRHLTAKVSIEKYLFESGIPTTTVVRPAAYFENLDDPVNYNPLKKGSVKALSAASMNYCSTYDVGKACAVIYANPTEWDKRILEIASWKGTIYEIAQALEKVSGVATKGSLAMPIFFRWLFLNDLHNMSLYFEDGYKNSECSIEKFKAVVPDAMSAEDWFRFYGKYANGERIVPVTPPSVAPVTAANGERIVPATPPSVAPAMAAVETDAAPTVIPAEPVSAETTSEPTVSPEKTEETEAPPSAAETITA